jgi:hypothetical protein
MPESVGASTIGFPAFQRGGLKSRIDLGSRMLYRVCGWRGIPKVRLGTPWPKCLQCRKVSEIALKPACDHSIFS